MQLGYGLDDTKLEFRKRKEIFPYCTTASQALVPTQPRIQWVRSLFSGKNGRNLNLTPYIRLAPTLHGLEQFPETSSSIPW